MSKSVIERLKIFGYLNRDNAVLSRNQEYRGANVAHQLAIVRIGRRKNLESAYFSGQPRIRHAFEELGRAMRMPEAEISEQRVLARFQQLAMMFQDIALVYFALPFWTYESRVGQDDSANGRTKLARCDGRSHPAHRMPQNDRIGESEPCNQSNDVPSEILIQIPMRRRARLSVTSGVRHYNVVVIFETAYYRGPAGPASYQSVERNERGLVATRSQIMDADFVCSAGSAYPARHEVVARPRKKGCLQAAREHHSLATAHTVANVILRVKDAALGCLPDATVPRQA